MNLYAQLYLLVFPRSNRNLDKRLSDYVDNNKNRFWTSSSQSLHETGVVTRKRLEVQNLFCSFVDFFLDLPEQDLSYRFLAARSPGLLSII